MKFEIANDGFLEITAQTPAEVREVLKEFDLDPFEYVEALSTGTLVHRAAPPRRDNGAWFECEYTAGPEWLKPYMERLKTITGYEGAIPTIEDAPRFDRTFANLCPTHNMASARLDAKGYTAKGYVQCGDWAGRKAVDRAPGYFAESIQMKLGDQKHEPEMIQIGDGGLYKRNPNYMKHYAPHAAATNATLFGALLQWWLDTHANAAQRKVVADAIACHQSVCKTDTLGAWMLRSYEGGWRTGWDQPVITYVEWQQLTD